MITVYVFRTLQAGATSICIYIYYQLDHSGFSVNYAKRSVATSRRSHADTKQQADGRGQLFEATIAVIVAPFMFYIDRPMNMFCCFVI